MNWRICLVSVLLLVFFPAVGVRNLLAQGLEKVTEVEGISEYQLENGARVLLYPDNSAGTVTVAMTVLVGSRHEGYGETGMAHLLEHMLFKGSPRHQDIPKEMKDRGASFNGTTWYDRTNYYETLPASEENLEWALDLEADRLVNSFVRGEDLASEMTVVRNEFEIGENNPDRILMQRILANSFEWHNYGKTTIGNKVDLERVPIHSLKRFYEKFYQPDNIMLVIAGKFDPAKALELVAEKFGSLPRPKRKLEPTYTVEPPQDGERVVVLRRVGDVAVAAAGYHIPAAAHPDYPALEVLAQVLGDEPSGILYKELVEKKLSTSISTMNIIGHDPGMMLCFAQVPAEKSAEATSQVLLDTMRNAAGKIETENVTRGLQQIAKNRENLQANTQRFAIELSEWAAYGDWRLFFVHRDRSEKVTVDDVRRVAETYLLQSNETAGMFIPTAEPRRTRVPATPDIKSLVAGYTGRSKITEGEALGTEPAEIEARVVRGELDAGPVYALLPKKTRGDRVYMQMTLRFGTEEALNSERLLGAAELMPRLLNRGAGDLDYQQIQDRLNELKSTLNVSGGTGELTVSLQSRREHFADALQLVQTVLRSPTFPEQEFSVLREEIVSQLEQGRSEPQALCFNTLLRKLNPYPQGDIRYVPTIDESIERLNAVQLADIRELYEKFVSGQHGEVTIVGAFDADSALQQVQQVLAGWQVDQPYVRIAEPAVLDTVGESIVIITPDKKNAMYAAGLMFAAQDGDDDYEALLVANTILGGGALSNRLANRVRQKDGLSYMVQSMFRADDQDPSALFIAMAAANPDNRDKLVAAMQDEMQRIVESGVQQEELEQAKSGYLQNLKRGRTGDPGLLGLLHSQLRTGRTFQFETDKETAIQALTVDDVNAAVKKMVDLDRLIVITAGDFEKPGNDESADDK